MIQRQPSQPSLEEIGLETSLRIEDLIDRDAVDELCQSFYALFGIPIRIYSENGALFADAGCEEMGEGNACVRPLRGGSTFRRS
jgi:hypothetical protein